MPAPCIQRPELQAFLAGETPPTRSEEIAGHVDSCPTCQDTVVALGQAEDTFALGWKRIGEADVLEDADFRRGIAQILPSASPPRATQHPAIPSHLGPYRLQEQLGAGGMGQVFRAEHTKLKRTVALKLLPTHRGATDETIARFEREMEAIGQLDHPHIVRASDAGEDQGWHFLVMEHVAGLDLAALIHRVGPLAAADASEIARQAALGIAYAHDQHLVHRDIKPSNLMLAFDADGKPVVKVLDLGLALLTQGQGVESQAVTTVGALMGTVDYMAPEQGLDSHAIDHRADIYGLGATLFHLLTGKPPFPSADYGNLLQKLTAMAQQPAPSLAQSCPDAPEELVRIVDRMLARDPADRFSSAAEVAQELEECCAQHHLSQVLSSGLASARAQRPIHAAGRPAVRSSDARPPQSPWRLTLLAAIAASMLLGLFVYRVSTNVGHVVVKSSDPQTKVTVKRSGSRDGILVGTSPLRVWAGDYVVEVSGNAESVEVEPRSFSLQRQGNVQVVVTAKSEPTPTKGNSTQISMAHLRDQRAKVEQLRAQLELLGQEFKELHRKEEGGAFTTDEGIQIDVEKVRLRQASQEAKRLLSLAESAYSQLVDRMAGQNPSEAPPQNPAAPRYDGRTLDEWLSEVAYERKAERLADALRAVAATAQHPANAPSVAQTIDTLLEMTRQFGASPADHEAAFLNELAWLALLSLPPEQVVDRIVEEIPRGTQRSRRFLFYFLYPVRRGAENFPGISDPFAVNRQFLAKLRTRSADITAACVGLQHDHAWAATFLFSFGQVAQQPLERSVDAVPLMWSVATNADADVKARAMAALSVARAVAQPPAEVTQEVRVILDRHHLPEILSDVLQAPLRRGDYRVTTDDAKAKYLATLAVRELGPTAQSTLPHLLALLHSSLVVSVTDALGTDDRVPEFDGARSGTLFRSKVVAALAALGPAALDAIPHLVAFRQGLNQPMGHPMGHPTELMQAVESAQAQILGSQPRARVRVDGGEVIVDGLGKVLRSASTEKELPSFHFPGPAASASLPINRIPHFHCLHGFLAASVSDLQSGQDAPWAFDYAPPSPHAPPTESTQWNLQMASAAGKIRVLWGDLNNPLDTLAKVEELASRIQDAAGTSAEDRLEVDLRQITFAPFADPFPDQQLQGGMF